MIWSILDKKTLAVAAILFVAVLLVVCFPRFSFRIARKLNSILARIASKPRLSIFLSGLLAFSISMYLSLLKWPEPTIHDEFSYLLGADTFSHGRLTNPIHPLWKHFESFHIIHYPSYASKYPPGQSLALAAGQVVGGHAIVGVWLSMGLLGAANCWMFQAWLPSRWALLCSLLIILHLAADAAFPPAGFSYWSCSYWGGAVPAVGGALLFGSIRRLLPEPHLRNAIPMFIGLIILANSRPFEGLLVGLPVAVLLLVWFLTNGSQFRALAVNNIIAPGVVFLILAASAMGYYNWRVTGNPLTMPYQIHELRYMPAPFFLWQSPRPIPNYNHKELRDFYVGSVFNYYQRQKSLRGFAQGIWEKVIVFWRFYFIGLLTIPLLSLPFAIRDYWTMFAISVIAVLAACMSTVTWFQPHYAAPVTCLLAVILMQCIRHFRQWNWRGKHVGRAFIRASIASCVFAMVAYMGWLYFQNYKMDWQNYKMDWQTHRGHIAEELKESSGKHLVIVRYGPDHNTLREWVYNDSDIDAAKVVWARDMGLEQNCDLLIYFRDRSIWLLDADEVPPHLMKYPIAGTKGE